MQSTNDRSIMVVKLSKKLSALILSIMDVSKTSLKREEKKRTPKPGR